MKHASLVCSWNTQEYNFEFAPTFRSGIFQTSPGLIYISRCHKYFLHATNLWWCNGRKCMKLRWLMVSSWLGLGWDGGSGRQARSSRYWMKGPICNSNYIFPTSNFDLTKFREFSFSTNKGPNRLIRISYARKDNGFGWRTFFTLSGQTGMEFGPQGPEKTNNGLLQDRLDPSQPLDHLSWRFYH